MTLGYTNILLNRTQKGLTIKKKKKKRIGKVGFTNICMIMSKKVKLFKRAFMVQRQFNETRIRKTLLRGQRWGLLCRPERVKIRRGKYKAHLTKYDKQASMNRR